MKLIVLVEKMRKKGFITGFTTFVVFLAFQLLLSSGSLYLTPLMDFQSHKPFVNDLLSWVGRYRTEHRMRMFISFTLTV